MFEHTMLAAPARAGRTWSTMAGFAAQSALLTAAVLVPMVFPESLPKVQTVVNLFSPLAPPPPPPPPPDISAPRPTVVRELQIRNGVVFEPRTIPARPEIIIEEPLTEAERGGSGGITCGVVGGTVGGAIGGVLNSVLASAATAFRPPAPAPKPTTVEATKPAPTVTERLAVSRGVQEAMIVKRVIPVYPALARQARISGRVDLHGVIGTDGRIRELRLLSGHPLLAPAALDAVRQWIYRPTLLNGVPVEVEAPIIVNFTLN